MWIRKGERYEAGDRVLFRSVEVVKFVTPCAVFTRVQLCYRSRIRLICWIATPSSAAELNEAPDTSVKHHIFQPKSERVADSASPFSGTKNAIVQIGFKPPSGGRAFKKCEMKITAEVQSSDGKGS